MKNCLVVIRNKKSTFQGDLLQLATSTFSAGGYYFDKIALIPFDSIQEIGDQLTECCAVYDNIVVICDDSQVAMVEGYFGDNCPEEKLRAIAVLSFDKADKSYFEKIIKGWNALYGISYENIYIKVVGAPDSLINDAIAEARGITDKININIYDDYGDTTIVLTYSSLTLKMQADGVMRAFVSRLGDYIYSLENISLAERLFQALKVRHMTLSVAESFTGGGICKRLVEVSGVSEVFFEGLNTYSNQSKMQRLGVSELTLKQYGAVSESTARQMAQGLLATGNCNLAIATTGIAGPKSDNTNKPVGLAYIAVGTKDDIEVIKFNFEGDRQTITQTAINRALFLAYKKLK